MNKASIQSTPSKSNTPAGIKGAEAHEPISTGSAKDDHSQSLGV
jgi:hypothetical protein